MKPKGVYLSDAATVVKECYFTTESRSITYTRPSEDDDKGGRRGPKGRGEDKNQIAQPFFSSNE